LFCRLKKSLASARYAAERDSRFTLSLASMRPRAGLGALIGEQSGK
jgi:hypothetical protein